MLRPIKQEITLIPERYLSNAARTASIRNYTNKLNSRIQTAAVSSLRDMDFGIPHFVAVTMKLLPPTCVLTTCVPCKFVYIKSSMVIKSVDNKSCYPVKNGVSVCRLILYKTDLAEDITTYRNEYLVITNLLSLYIKKVNYNVLEDCFNSLNRMKGINLGILRSKGINSIKDLINTDYDRVSGMFKGNLYMPMNSMFYVLKKLMKHMHTINILDMGSNSYSVYRLNN